MQRRKFVIAAGGLLGAAGLHSASALAATAAALAPAALPSALQAPLAKAPGSAAFGALLNQSFNVYASQRGESMQLVAVKGKHAAERHDQFSLLFAAGAGSTLASGTYQVEHAATGMQAMYLEASGGDGRGPLYRADFSLLA